MMTALIKMEKIEEGCVTMELYNYLPQAFVLPAAFHTQTDRREEGGEETRRKRRGGLSFTWLKF